MRDDAFAQLGDTNLADGVAAGQLAELPGDERRELHRNPGQIARRGQRHLRGALLPASRAARPAGRFAARRRRRADPERHLDRQLRLHRPRVARSSGPPAPGGRRSTGTASSAAPTEVGVQPAAQPRPGPRHRPVRDRRDRHVADRPPGRGRRRCRTSRDFPTIADRLQQGLLDELYLGRAMISPSGFTTDAAFHQDGTLATPSVLDTSRLFYNGNSQGGIMGGALTAVAPDFTRASLGVPAMNYSVLLPRSVDFDEFARDPLPVLPGRDRAAAGPRPDPDALGPRRAERLRAPDDRRPAAGHAAAPGADERRLRRPPGDRTTRPTSRRGRSAPPPTGRSSTPAAGPTPTCSGTCRRSRRTRTPAR